MLKILLFISMLYAISATAVIEADHLKEFFKDYDASKERRNYYWPRLAFAIEKGYIDIANFLLCHHDPISHYSENTSEYQYNKHPLTTAVRLGHLETVKLILDYLPDFSSLNETRRIKIVDENCATCIEFSEQNYNLMHIAIAESPIPFQMVCCLLDYGYPINQSFYFTSSLPCQTPLKTAIAANKLDVLELLLERGADPEFAGFDGYGPSPLYEAIESESIEVVKILLRYGADPLKKEWGWMFHWDLCPLELALEKGNEELINLLLKAALKSEQPFQG